MALKRIGIIVLFLVCSASFGQNQKQIDSLRGVYNGTGDFETRIRAAAKMIELYTYEDPKQAADLLKEALSKSEKNDSKLGQYHIYCEYANFYNVHSKYDSAIYHAKKSLDLVNELKDSSLYSVPNLHLAWSYSIKGDFDSAKKVTLQNLEISKAIDDWGSLAESYFGAGNLYFYESDFPKAIEAYIKTDSILQERDPHNMTLINTNINIAQLLIVDKNFDTALEYLDKSEKVALQNDNGYGIASTQLIRGIVETKTKNFETAFENLKKAEKFFISFQSDFDLAECYYYLGEYYYNSQDFEKALEYQNKALDLYRKVQDPMGIANSQYALGLISKGKKQYNNAVEHIEKALKNFDALNNEDIIEQKVAVYKDLSELYASLNQYEKAYAYADEHNSLNNTLISKQNSGKLNDLETKYQTEKKEQEIALLNSEKEIIEQQKTNQRNLLLGGIGLTSLIGLFLFVQYRNRQKTNEKLRELDSLKSNFFANISHEFRTPLTLISAPIEQRLGTSDLSASDKQDFEMIQRNSNRLLNLVDQLLDLSKLEAGKYQLRATSGNLGNLILALGESFEFTGKQLEIDYEIKVDGLQDAWYDKDVVEKIVANLLSNAMKYTDTGGSISLQARRANDNAVISVENTANVMDKEVIEKLFDRFYQANAQTEGVGIGLSLVKELVSINRGSLNVDQNLESALRFEILLPITKSAYKKDELAQQVDGTEVVVTMPSALAVNVEILEDINEEDDRDMLLLIEDNAEVRLLLRNTFDNAYRIVEATNGEEGVEQALKYVPDLIISDIMMPKMNGLELCEQLKTNECTSHIPIILLTAKAGEEDQYKGLSTGADAYVTKPFKVKLLETRVTKLIESRKALRDRYSQEIILKPKDIAITNLDEHFLEKVQDVLEQKLTESSFSIQEFSEALGMSRMQLHRKLKALTGLSASEFVRSQRLKLAASLLEKSDINVSQIGYQVGFNDPSYFSKCFKEAYGVSPSDYTQKESS